MRQNTTTTPIHAETPFCVPELTTSTLIGISTQEQLENPKIHKQSKQLSVENSELEQEGTRPLNGTNAEVQTLRGVMEQKHPVTPHMPQL
jgi:hypothetical protein